MWIWNEMLLHTGGTNYLASMMKSFQIWRNMEGCFPLSWNKDSFCKLICQSFIAEFKIYCWKNIFCEKLATFMRHLLRLRRITSGYLFPDLLNGRLNTSEIEALMECRHIWFFSNVLSLILVEKGKILLLGLHAIFFLGWNETKVSIPH